MFDGQPLFCQRGPQQRWRRTLSNTVELLIHGRHPTRRAGLLITNAKRCPWQVWRSKGKLTKVSHLSTTRCSEAPLGDNTVSTVSYQTPQVGSPNDGTVTPLHTNLSLMPRADTILTQFSSICWFSFRVVYCYIYFFFFYIPLKRGYFILKERINRIPE